MKSSFMLLAFIVVLLLTWLLTSTIVYFLSNDTFKQSMTEPGVLGFMVILGWIPSVIVIGDIDEEY